MHYTKVCVYFSFVLLKNTDQSKQIDDENMIKRKEKRMKERKKKMKRRKCVMNYDGAYMRIVGMKMI